MKKRLILSSLLTILMSASIAAGATYALFDSKSETHVEVGSGKVSLVSEVKANTLKLYSMGEKQSGSFANGGKAVIDGHNVSINGMTPGDKAEFDLAIKNFSTVATKYRVKVRCETGYELYSKLNFTYGAITNWTTLQPDANPDNPTEQVDKVTIELPQSTGNDAQGLTTSLVVSVEAVQGNAEVVYDDIDVVKPSNGSTTIAETGDVAVKTDNGAVKVNIPDSRVDRGQEAAVVNVRECTTGEKENFVVDADSSTAYYDIDVKGINATDETPVDVELYIGKNLHNVSVQHDTGSGVETIEPINYNPLTGYVKFSTTSFSAFAITSEKRLVVDASGTPEENGNRLYDSLCNIKEKGTVQLEEGDYALPKEYETHRGLNITIVGVGSKTTIRHALGGELLNLATNDSVINLKDLRIVSPYDTLSKKYYSVIKTDRSVKNSKITSENVEYASELDGQVFFGKNPAKVEHLDKKYSFVYGGSCVFLNNGIYEIHSIADITTNIEDALNGVYTLESDLFITPEYSTHTGAKHLLDLWLKKNTTINLNGHTIQLAFTTGFTTNSTPVLIGVTKRSTAPADSTLTITGNGTIDSSLGNDGAYAMNVKGSTNVVIENGTFIGGPTCVQVQDGTLTVKDGYFKLSEGAATNDTPKDHLSTYLINCIDKTFNNESIINVTGGTFVGFDVNDNPEGPETTYLVEGYETYQDGTEVVGGKTYNVYKVRPVVQG